MIILYRTIVLILFLAISHSSFAAPEISEINVRAEDGNVYTVPYYTDFFNADEKLTAYAIPYNEFYVRISGKINYFIERSLVAKLYEASINISILADQDGRIGGFVADGWLDAFSNFEQQQSNQKFVQFIDAAGVVGQVALACKGFAIAGGTVGTFAGGPAGTAVGALGGCLIGASVTVSTSAVSIATDAKEYSTEMNLQTSHLVAIRKLLNDYQGDYVSSPSWNYLTTLQTQLLNNEIILLSELEIHSQNIIYYDRYLQAVAYGLSIMPLLSDGIIKDAIIDNVIQVGGSAVGNTLFSATVNVSGAFYSVYSKGDTNTLTTDAMGQLASNIYQEHQVAIPTPFHELTLGKHQINLYKFQDEEGRLVKSDITADIKETSLGSQIRLKFTQLPPNNKLSVRNNLKTWIYSIPTSGNVYADVRMGTTDSLFYKVNNPEGDILLNETSIDIRLKQNAITGVVAQPLTDGVRISYSGLPSDFNSGVIICRDSNDLTNSNIALSSSTRPTVGSVCVDGQFVKVGVGSFDDTGLAQGEIAYYAAIAYKYIAATETDAAHYNYSSPVYVSARPNIAGTLKKTNWEDSVLHPYRISGELNVPANDPFIWYENSVYNTLTIAKNVTIHMLNTNSSINVYGTLNAYGSEAEPVVFGSDNAAPAPGDWGHIRYMPGARGDFFRTIVEYGGSGGATIIADGTPGIYDMSLRDSSGHGVWIRGDSKALISSSSITGVSGYGIYATYSGEFATINQYTVGLNYLDGVSGGVSLGSQASSDMPVIFGNESSKVQKTINAVAVSGTISKDTKWTGDVKLINEVTVAEGVTLTIAPGVTVYGYDVDSGLHVEGTLIAEATNEGERIVFTSDNEAPTAGNWDGIWFKPGSNGSLKYVTIAYAGGGTCGYGCGSNFSSAIRIDSAPTLDHVIVRDVDYSGHTNTSHGIQLVGSAAPIITNALIENVSAYGIHVPTNATGDYSITDSEITGATNGVYISGTGTYQFANNNIHDNTNTGTWHANGGSTVVNNTITDNGGNDALYVSGIISADTTWTDDVKLVNEVTVTAGVTLTIAPGVKVYGYDVDSGLHVEGTLIADATSDANRIVFTSDNETPLAGNWDGIWFKPGSSGSLKYVTVAYAGGGTCGYGCGSNFSSAIRIDSAPTLDHVIVRDVDYSGHTNTSHGIQLVGSAAPIITNALIENVSAYGIHVPTNATGDYSITDSEITGATNGVYISGTGTYQFANNNIHDNTNTGTWHANGGSTVVNNTITDNGGNDALYVSGIISADTTWTDDVKLVNEVTVAAGVTLTIAPGVKVYGHDVDSGLHVEGTLIANATSDANRVVFTSGNATPVAGDWDGIWFKTGSSGSLKYVTVAYAGGGTCGYGCGSNFSSAIRIDSAPTLDHVIVRDVDYSGNSQLSHGIELVGSAAPIISDLTLNNISNWAIYSTATKSLAFNPVTILGTKDIKGAYAANGFLNLTQIDWGTATGPYHATENPDGLGATVSGNVLFKWWKGEDTDGDGLPDYWEYLYGSNANVATNTSSDNDGDGLTLLEEFQLGTDFNSVDTDEDGLSDAWESEHGMQATVASDASQDSDGDGLTNLEEFTLGTDINLADSDNDGFADNLDELPLITGEHLDFDKDGVGDFADNDDDNDGIPDSFEFSHGLNSKNASDALLDMDGDGSSNLDEFLVSTDLNNASANATVHQHIIPLQTNIMVRAGNEFYSYLNYETTDANTALPGLAFRLHFSSAAIEYIETSAIFDTNFIVDSGVQIDTDNADNDPNTDSFLSFTWQDNSASWPGVEDLRLLKLKFKLLDSVAVNSQHVVNFSVINTQISADNIAYGFNSTSMVITEGYALDLDINGDGIIDGLTDGAIFTRFMMGYSVESISTEAEMINSTRTKQEMYQLLQAINNKQTVL